MNKLKSKNKYFYIKTHILIKIFFFLIVFCLYSCQAESTNWAYVNKFQSNNLLAMSDNINFENTTYELKSYYLESAILFSDDNKKEITINTSTIYFFLHEKNLDDMENFGGSPVSYYDNTELARKLKPESFWIINKTDKYYFQTSNLEHIINTYFSDLGTYSLKTPNNYKPSFYNIGKNLDEIIVKFVSVSNNKIYFIKSFISRDLYQESAMNQEKERAKNKSDIIIER